MKFILSCLLFTLFLSFGSNTAQADTIKLKNGYTIYGKVNEIPQKPSHYRVTFKRGGWQLLRKTEVDSIEVNDRDQFEEREKREQ